MAKTRKKRTFRGVKYNEEEMRAWLERQRQSGLSFKAFYLRNKEGGCPSDATLWTWKRELDRKDAQKSAPKLRALEKARAAKAAKAAKRKLEALGTVTGRKESRTWNDIGLEFDAMALHCGMRYAEAGYPQDLAIQGMSHFIRLAYNVKAMKKK